MVTYDEHDHALSGTTKSRAYHEDGASEHPVGGNEKDVND